MPAALGLRLAPAWGLRRGRVGHIPVPSCAAALGLAVSLGG